MNFTINSVNWLAYPGRNVEVEGYMNVTPYKILLHYKVKEPYVYADKKKINSDVYKDTCVEFFVSFDKKNYYNFEFNCIGTVLAQYGKDRETRRYIPTRHLKKIKVRPSLGTDPLLPLLTPISGKGVEWELDITIPLTCFCYDFIPDLTTVDIYGNFYKCGDDLPEKHYLTAYPVDADSPDFHRLDSFKKLNES